MTVLKATHRRRIQGTLPASSSPTSTRLSDLEDMGADTAWMSRGVCAETDPELFFAPLDAGPGWDEPAKRICRGCPVRAVCLSYAVANGIEYGVWGGLTEKDRRAAENALVA